MEGTLEPDRFYIARMLHMTLGDLADMPMAEYHQWRAFLVYEASLRELARKGHG